MAPTRRTLLAALGSAGLPTSLWAAARQTRRLPAWQPGLLDIHQIDTGRGSSTFILAPDGTTILVDCGDVPDSPDALPMRPDASRRAGEWVARYARRHAAAAGRTEIDYAIATHVHPDHVGDPAGRQPPPGLAHVPTGLSEVDALLPIAAVIDRGFPDYASLAPLDAPFARNHLAWLQHRRQTGRTVEVARVGAVDQIRPRTEGAFEFRIVAANGLYWQDGKVQAPHAPAGSSVPVDENRSSIAFRLQFGAFRYFAGADLACDTEDGRFPWLDVETPIARSVGPVSVALANHHGYFDAVGAEAARALDPKAWIVPAWHASHPSPAQLQRMLNAWTGERVRPVYVTRLHPAAAAVNGRFRRQLAGEGGHIVVRAQRDGRFAIWILDSRTEEDSPLLEASL